MGNKDAANKTLNRMYGGTVDRLKAEHERRTGADTQRSLSIPIRPEETARKKALAAAFQEQEAEAERQRAVVAEAEFKNEEKRKYLAAGGLESDFDTNWPGLRQQIVERRFFDQPDSNNRTTAQRTLDTRYKR